MKKRFYFVVAALVCVVTTLCFMSCTDQSMAKTWGGNATIELPKDNVPISGSWKGESNLWVMMKDTITNEIKYKEYSSWGIVEGEIKLVSPKE